MLEVRSPYTSGDIGGHLASNELAVAAEWEGELRRGACRLRHRKEGGNVTVLSLNGASQNLESSSLPPIGTTSTSSGPALLVLVD